MGGIWLLLLLVLGINYVQVQTQRIISKLEPSTKAREVFTLSEVLEVFTLRDEWKVAIKSAQCWAGLNRL